MIQNPLLATLAKQILVSHISKSQHGASRGFIKIPKALVETADGSLAQHLKVESAGFVFKVLTIRSLIGQECQCLILTQQLTDYLPVEEVYYERRTKPKH